MRGAHARPPPPPRAAPPRALARSTLRRHPWAHLRAARRYLSARNIPYLNLITLDNINARDILKAKKVVVSSSAMSTLRDRYGAD